MTGNNILLDTCVIIELFKGNAAVTASFELYASVDIPFVALGELYFGAYKSSDPAKHVKQINNFMNNCNVVAGDEETANSYAAIKALLLKKGKPIPENDIWIAAIARQYSLSLITRDKHFEEVDNLTVVYW